MIGHVRKEQDMEDSLFQRTVLLSVANVANKEKRKGWGLQCGTLACKTINERAGRHRWLNYVNS